MAQGTATWAAISLGSNLGPGEDLFRRALDELHGDERGEVLATSSLYRTPPWGEPDQPDFLNAVALLRWQADAEQLLTTLLSTETALGRERDPNHRWGPRRIDLDLLLFGELVCATSTLELPHPRLAERRFVLEPLAELAPDALVPGLGSAGQLLEACADPARLTRMAGPSWWTGTRP